MVLAKAADELYPKKPISTPSPFVMLNNFAHNISRTLAYFSRVAPIRFCLIEFEVNDIRLHKISVIPMLFSVSKTRVDAAMHQISMRFVQFAAGLVAA
jgi:hypothetical protein